MDRIRVGCSGWQYKHWRGDFYPSDLPQKRWFEHYATVFDTVEINNSFYRLPEESTFAAWAARAPRGFLFAVKASRFLTHMKKLKDPEEPVERFFSRVRALGRHLGPVLYQLPPGWKLDRDRLEHFLQVLPRGVRHVLEFRDPSLVHGRGVASCWSGIAWRCACTTCAVGDRPACGSGPFVYVRFHGATRHATTAAIRTTGSRDWAEWLHGERTRGADVLRVFQQRRRRPRAARRA